MGTSWCLRKSRGASVLEAGWGGGLGWGLEEEVRDSVGAHRSWYIVSILL